MYHDQQDIHIRFIKLYPLGLQLDLKESREYPCPLYIK